MRKHLMIHCKEAKRNNEADSEAQKQEPHQVLAQIPEKWLMDIEIPCKRKYLGSTDCYGSIRGLKWILI